MSESPIMAGTLQDLDLSMVMDVTSLGRQTLRLEVMTSSGATIGFVVVKAGRVISAQAGAHHGPAALAVILNADANARFRLVRDTSRTDTAVPFAMVGEPIKYPQSASSLFAEGTNPKIRVMEGSLTDFDVPTLLQTIGMGRMYMEIDVLSETGEAIGSVFLKAGKIMSARTGSFEGLQAVRELLESPKHFHFAVFRVDDEVSKKLQSVDPVGGLSQVLMDAQPRTERATHPVLPRPERVTAPRDVKVAADRTPIMAGLLSEFDVPTLLQTLGVGRQYVGLEVHDGGTLVGQIMVKAGMVVSASAGELSGVAAFRKVVQSPTSFSFDMFRTTAAVPAGEPLGPMHRLLMSAMEPVAPVASAKVPAATMLGMAPPPAAIVAAQTAQSPVRASIATNRVAVMSGALADFGIATLLETLSQSRQHIVIELLHNHNLLGTIHVKSGMVCEAKSGTLTGVPAFNVLLTAPSNGNFCVYTELAAVGVEQPLGALSDLVRDATTVNIGSTPVHHAHFDRIATDITPAKRRNAMWIGVGVAATAIAAVAMVAFVLFGSENAAGPQAVDMETQVQTVENESAPAQATMPAEPAPPVQEVKPAEPSPPVVATKPAPPAPPVQEVKPSPPVAEVKPAEPAPPVVATKPAPPSPPVQIAKPEPPPVQATKPAPPSPPVQATKPAQASSERTPSSAMSTRAAQAILSRLGYPVGPIDNIFGRKTSAAVTAFQKAEGLDATGMLNAATIQALAAK